jgi:hypothetical protein
MMPNCFVRRQSSYLSCEITWVLDLDGIDAGDNIAGLEEIAARTGHE